MKVLNTGCSGFIGFHLANLLIKNKIEVIGIDNLNNYYDVKIKKNIINILKKNKKNFNFFKFDISNKKKIDINFSFYKYDYVVNLAAQAGVRYSIQNPKSYLEANIVGFFNMICSCTNGLH